MKYSHVKMSDPKTQEDKIGSFAKRGARNTWAEQQEELVRSLSPFPITYDVNPTQGTNFAEFSYTELLGGLWVSSQSVEVNARLLDLASQCPSQLTLKQVQTILDDKYIMQPAAGYGHVTKCVFLPGHNALDIASAETISRIAHEEEDVYFKPHPITHDDAIKLVAKRVGWNRMLPKDISGMSILRQCTDVYTSTASEMAVTGTILGKKVHNISAFFYEGHGAYHAISRNLFLAHKKHGVEEAQRLLLNMFNCPWSGLLFPFHTDVEDRLKAFYNKALELRELYKPLAAPRHPMRPDPQPQQSNG